jgi:two-component system cell cycle sensor histidine kinase PleC
MVERLDTTGASPELEQPPGGAEQRDRLTLDQLRIVAQNLRPNPIMMPLMAAFICAMFADWVAWPRLALWYGLMLLGLVPLTAVTHAFLRHEPGVADSRRWVRRFSLAVFVFTVGWGSMALLLWVPGNDFDHVLIILVVGSTLAGNCVLAGASRHVTNAGFLIYGPIMVLVPLRSSGLVYAELSVLAALYVAFLFYMGRVYNQVACDMLLLREEKRSLIERLQRALADATAARRRTEAASQAKSDFLARMSHELRTPLNAILGFSEVIRDRTFGNEALDRYADYAGSIHVSGRHLLGLVNDVLDLSKIEAGKVELSESVFDLVAVAADVIRLVEPLAARKSLDLTLEAPPALAIRADELAIRQILVNLLSNALKFTLREGRVALRITDTAHGPLTITVSDSGVGIPLADLDRVLESFGQGRHDVAAHDERGTGLGLPIVKGLVEAHGGVLRLVSDVGVGTTVTVDLPASRIVGASDRSAAAS